MSDDIDDVLDEGILDIDPEDIIEEPVDENSGNLPKHEEENERGLTEESDEILEALNEDLEYPEQHPIIKDESLVNDPGQLVTTNIQPGQPLQKALENPARTDKLLIAVRDRQPTLSVLNKVMEEIAEETAYLKAYRNKHWEDDVDISETSFKRVRMLKSLVETILEREKQKASKSSGKIDFYSENFKNVLKFFLQSIEKTFKKVNIPQQFTDNFFAELAKEFDGFEKKAEKIYNGKGGPT